VIKKIFFTLFVSFAITFAFSAAVYAYDIPTTLRIGLESKYMNVASAAVLNTAITVNGMTLTSDIGFAVICDGANILLNDGTGTVMTFDDSNILQISAVDGFAVNLGLRQYRGVIEFDRTGAGKMILVNILPMDEYLYGVVPSEMPSSWPEEALKAQAVAARSYALDKIGSDNHTGYDLCDTTHCQVYLGVGNEHDAATAAVDATSGQVACYDGEPINAVYSSSSGGHTDSSENVWSATVPYLRGVDDPTDVGNELWTRIFTLDDITALVKAWGANIGTATGMEITKVENERVQTLVVHGTSGDLTLTKEETRTFFSGSAQGSLQSRNYTIANGTGGTDTPTNVAVYSADGVTMVPITGLFATDASGAEVPLGDITVVGDDSTASYAATSGATGGASVGDTILLSGSGNGHGVGMSQYGAMGMAEQGATYIDILQHYYTGIDIE